jgi:multicomponent Na+:H+ antiporter subunit A
LLALVLAHFLAAACAPALVRVLGPRAFLLLALVPAIAAGWAVTWTSRMAEGVVRTEVADWVPALDLQLAFAMGSLQWVMVLVVAGIGALVLVFCTGYFTRDDAGLAAFAGYFVAFAGSMLGLVLADDLLLLYVFWELTTVFSYLLIGIDPAKRAGRAAGLQALVVTTFGGLAMLVGVLVLGVKAGTFRISEVLADPPSGTAITVAVLLVLVGAISKSALFPFHFWLPAAMAAPTPVSAYLHAAAMVKAGVYLVALLAPAFAEVPGWHGVLLTLGVFTMLLGGWRALRQYDIKLLLAYGTVSQLGFLLVVVSVGTRDAALAGLAMLIAHALFKATLFLVVGIVDRRTGTRDIRQLSGLGRSSPYLLWATILAGASMAGVPPLAGFVAKESVFAAVAGVAEHGEGTGLSPLAGWTVLAGVVVGSALTVAYTARFVWGTFATKLDTVDTAEAHTPRVMLFSPLLLAIACLVLGFLGGAETKVLAPYAESIPGGHLEKLALWHGLGLPLALSAVSLGVGLLLFWRRVEFASFQSATRADWSTERGYLRLVRLLDRTAVEVTGLVQRGSVTTYVGVILMVVVLLPGAALLTAAGGTYDVIGWDNPGQVVVAGIIVVAAVQTTRSRRRLKAVVLVGVTGYGTAMLFLLHGAPDLALTQVLVETVTIVAFVLVLRRLPEYFNDTPLTRRRYWRMAIGAAVAVVVAGIMIYATGARTETPVSAGFPQEAVEFGGGNNIVNVTLVDIRAWDTMGEISVLVAAATGVASLVFIRTRRAGVRRVDSSALRTGSDQPTATEPPRRIWLPASRTLTPDRRSIIFEVVTRLVFHTIIVFSIFLLLSGHNAPGGGFAAGLVTGLALVVRYLAGGRYELDEAAPVDAGALMGTGLFIAAMSGLAPLAFGGAVLQSAVIDIHLPLLGDLHLVTSVFFDVGVYVLVVGLVLDLLRSLGAGIDRQAAGEQQHDDATLEVTS